MMKYIVLFFLLLATFSVRGEYQNSIMSDADYQSLCEREKPAAYSLWNDNLCKRLKNGDGSWVQPDPAYLKLLQVLDPKFTAIGRKLGINPLAVKAAFTAENSMNITVHQSEKDFLKAAFGTHGANQLSKAVQGVSFSEGIGQIKIEAAEPVEPLLAKIEGRPQRDYRQIEESLKDPEQSIKYGAAIIRTCQDAYKAQGFDISENIPVLASLYNLGKCTRRAADAKERADRSGKTYAPQPNYFGYFVKNWLGDIDRETRLDDPSKGSGDVGNFERFQRLKSQIVLSASPPECKVKDTYSSSHGRAHDYTKYEDMTFGPSVGVANPGEFQVVGGAPDCDGLEWSLIHTHDGMNGWTSKKVLDSKSEEGT